MKAVVQTRVNRIEEVGFDYTSFPKTGVTPCNLCGSDRWVIIALRDRYGFPAKTTTCSKCGLTALNPRMTRDGYSSFYQNYYRPLVSAYHGREISPTSIKMEQAVYAESFIEFASPFMGREHRTMLDVGGSTGVVGSKFEEAFGLKVTVIDPAPGETSEAHSIGLETITSFVEDWDPSGRTFDVIGMFQTVDHLLDVKNTLLKLRSVIEEPGVFLVDIVDFRAAYLRAGSIEEALKIDHVYSLTEETMEVLLAQTGFQWIRKQYAEDHLHIAYVCVPSQPNPRAKTDQSWVTQQLREIRQVQNSQ